MLYPVVLTPDDNDTVFATFPDFPEAHTFGDDKVEALTRAVDALETIIDAYIRDRRLVPMPSAIKGEWVVLPALVDAKVQIYNSMLQQRVGKAELARRLKVHLPQVDRLLDLRHGSKVDQLEAAADALGGRLVITFEGPADEITSDMAAALIKPRRRSRTRTIAGRSSVHKAAAAHRATTKSRKTGKAHRNR